MTSTFRVATNLIVNSSFNPLLFVRMAKNSHEVTNEVYEKINLKIKCSVQVLMSPTTLSPLIHCLRPFPLLSNRRINKMLSSSKSKYLDLENISIKKSY